MIGARQQQTAIYIFFFVVLNRIFLVSPLTAKWFQSPYRIKETIKKQKASFLSFQEYQTRDALAANKHAYITASFFSCNMTMTFETACYLSLINDIRLQHIQGNDVFEIFNQDVIHSHRVP